MKKACLLLLMIAMCSTLAYSQYPDPGLEKWINIGSLQSKFQAGGAERAYNNVYYEGMAWPAWYSYTDNHVIDRQWLVCRNYTADDGNIYSYLGIYFSPSSTSPYYGYPVKLEQTAKFESPVVKVNDADAGQINYIDDYHADDVSYERKIVNVFNSYLGVEYTRTVYAFSQQYHDNYFITEYVLKNTGNIDYDEEIELPSNSINDLLFAIMPRYATSREAGYITDRQMIWGKHQWISFMDIQDVADCNPDSLRCFWTWLGQGDQNDGFDHIGAPDGGNGTLFNSKAGRLASPQFAGMAVLHADKSASDKSNDNGQPSTLAWHGGDTYPSVYDRNESGSEELYNMLTWTALYDGLYNTGEGDTLPMVGTDPLRKPYGDEKPQTVPGNETGGPAALMTFGPYDLPNIGDSIKIVVVEAVNGLSRQKCIEVGENWLAGTNLILPDGSTASNRDQYKNEWFYTGRDSLFLSFKRADYVYKNGMMIQNPPQPPAAFNVNAQPEHIQLDWTASPSESDLNFGGYRVYRAIANPDSNYEEIFACGAGTGQSLTYEYQDAAVLPGYSYKYYITTFTDGAAASGNILSPGGDLESSRSYTMTTLSAKITGFPPDGSGSEEDPYRIDSIEDYEWIKLNPEKWDKYYKQICDINFSGVDDFQPIGNSGIYFTGYYDGQGYVIDSLTIDKPGEGNLGLFGITSGAVIKNVHLTHLNVNGTDYVGGLVGNSREGTGISSCHCSGSVTGLDCVGGLVGQHLSSMSLFDCYSEGTVNGDNRVGGLVGNVSASTIRDNYSRMTVNGGARTGGLLGQVVLSEIHNSYCNGSVTGDTDTGGLIGYAYQTGANNCFWDTETSGQSVSADGTGKTTVEMKMASTYTDSGWNVIDTWIIDPTYNEGYPVLKWQVDGVGVCPDMPEQFVLEQNYPNPFNPTTTITFQLPADGNVELSIFDLSGRRIVSLLNGHITAGYHQIKWNASDHSSGVYIYRLHSGSYTETKKMVLMK